MVDEGAVLNTNISPLLKMEGLDFGSRNKNVLRTTFQSIGTFHNNWPPLFYSHIFLLNDDEIDNDTKMFLTQVNQPANVMLIS